VSKHYPLLLLFIAVFYAFTAIKSTGFHQPDEHFQIVEFANYKLGKTKAKEAYTLDFNGLDVTFNELTSTTKNPIIAELSTSLGTTLPTLSERAIIIADYEMGYKGKKCTPPVQP